MKHYKVIDNTIYFRQSFDRKTLANLFTVIYALGLSIGDGIRHYPHSVQITESEFLSCLDMARGA
jgi:hypothetical protein